VKKVILAGLRFYKKYLSRGYWCRYSPTCSEYMYEAVEKYGIGKGLFLGIKRLGRCHPGSKGGVDLVE
jgi:putative membrane protein insertion efficiency factor